MDGTERNGWTNSFIQYVNSFPSFVMNIINHLICYVKGGFFLSTGYLNGVFHVGGVKPRRHRIESWCYGSHHSRKVNSLIVCESVKLAAALQWVSSFLFFLSLKSFTVESSVHHMFKYEVIVFVIPNVWVCRKGMTSRLQQLCVQPSRTPVSLPKVLSNPSDPWWILHKHAKNTIYWDYTFKIKWIHLKKHARWCWRGS